MDAVTPEVDENSGQAATGQQESAATLPLQPMMTRSVKKEEASSKQPTAIP
jgi:hypothetical protein